MDEFLQHKEISEKRFNEFIKERFEGETSIWSPVTKTKLPTFALNVKKKQVKFNNTIVTIKEERKLMSRLIIAAKSRPNVDLSTLRAETFAGRNFRDFRDFWPFSRKFLPGKKLSEKFAKVIFAKKRLFRKIAKVFSEF